MMKRYLLSALLMGGLLGLTIGCSKATTPVVVTPATIPPMPGTDGVKSGGGKSAGPAEKGPSQATPIPLPDGPK